jgi:hypothetical protein
MTIIFHTHTYICRKPLEIKVEAGTTISVNINGISGIIKVKTIPKERKTYSFLLLSFP